VPCPEWDLRLCPRAIPWRRWESPRGFQRTALSVNRCDRACEVTIQHSTVGHAATSLSEELFDRKCRSLEMSGGAFASSRRRPRRTAPVGPSRTRGGRPARGTRHRLSRACWSGGRRHRRRRLLAHATHRFTRRRSSWDRPGGSPGFPIGQNRARRFRWSEAPDRQTRVTGISRVDRGAVAGNQPCGPAGRLVRSAPRGRINRDPFTRSRGLHADVGRATLGL